MVTPEIPLPPTNSSVLEGWHVTLVILGMVGGSLLSIILFAFRAGALYRDFKSLEAGQKAAMVALERSTANALATMDRKIEANRLEQNAQHGDVKEDLRRIETDMHTMKNELQTWPIKIGTRLDERIDSIFERMADPQHAGRPRPGRRNRRARAAEGPSGAVLAGVLPKVAP